MTLELFWDSIVTSLAAGFLLTQATVVAGGKFNLFSSAFGDGKVIPAQYANTGVSAGKNISPPLGWTNPPDQTKSFALACVDRHPIANNWVHWLVINIPGSAAGLVERASRSEKLPAGAKELQNTFGTAGWGGPQPPRGSGSHQYEFLLYALNVESLNLSPNATLSAFNKAVEGKVIAAAKLVGTYER